MKDIHKEKYLQVGMNVYHYRKKKGLTQEQLAEDLGVSRNQISNIEAYGSKAGPSLDLLFDIADYFNIKPKDLFFEREE